MGLTHTDLIFLGSWTTMVILVTWAAFKAPEDLPRFRPSPKVKEWLDGKLNK